MSLRPIRVAVIGAGPAGIYAADILTREHPDAHVDLIERLPAPYGLVRYGVAPDHPRIKEVVKALRNVLNRPTIRLFGNVAFGTDLKLSDLQRFYDAVIFATGAMGDRRLEIPGVELQGSHGAADFVSWYDGHPDVSRDWPLDAHSVAVLGAGNVALDVARMLAKPADEQLVTDIPDNVYAGLMANKAREIHIFARRGPAHAKFSSMELRELSHSPEVDVVVEEDGFQIDDAGQTEVSTHKSTRLVADTLLRYLVESKSTATSRRVIIHLMHNPREILGRDGKVVAIRSERTAYNGDGTVSGTGQFVDTPVQAVYRAIGYRSSPLSDVPFDHTYNVIPNEAGRVLGLDGDPLTGAYVTGWIKRGPVGLIGHTKSDAKETIDCLLTDLDKLPMPECTDPGAVLDHLRDAGVPFTTSEGWDMLDAHEMAQGAARGRTRVKVVPREEMVRVSNE